MYLIIIYILLYIKQDYRLLVATGLANTPEKTRCITLNELILFGCVILVLASRLSVVYKKCRWIPSYDKIHVDVTVKQGWLWEYNSEWSNKISTYPLIGTFFLCRALFWSAPLKIWLCIEKRGCQILNPYPSSPTTMLSLYTLYLCSQKTNLPTYTFNI